MYYYINSHRKGTVRFEEKFSPYTMVLWANRNLSEIVCFMESPRRVHNALSVYNMLLLSGKHTYKLIESTEFHLLPF